MTRLVTINGLNCYVVVFVKSTRTNWTDSFHLFPESTSGHDLKPDVYEVTAYAGGCWPHKGLVSSNAHGDGNVVEMDLQVTKVMLHVYYVQVNVKFNSIYSAYSVSKLSDNKSQKFCLPRINYPL